MHVIVFDSIISEPKKHCKDPYNSTYTEIEKVLEKNGSYWIQGSTYATGGDLRILFKTMQGSKKPSWFCLLARDIHAFKIEGYSDLTEEFRENTNS